MNMMISYQELVRTFPKLSTLVWRRLLYGYELSYPSDIELIQITGNGRSTKDRK